MVAFNPALLLAYGSPVVALSSRYTGVVDQADTTPGYYLMQGDAQDQLYSTAATLPPFASNMTGIAFSPDGTKLAVTASNATNGLTVYDITTNPPTLVTQKSTPGAAVGKPLCCGWSPNSRFLAVGYHASPFFTVYDTQSSYATLTLPGTVPNAAVNNILFNTQGTRLIVDNHQNTLIDIYQISGTTLTFDSTLAPTAPAPELRLSADGTVLVASLTASPGLNTWTVSSNGTVFTKNTDPSGGNALSLSTLTGLSINAAKTLIAITDTATPFIHVYDYPALTLHANPGTLPTHRAWDCTYTEDGVELLLTGEFGTNLEGYTVSGMTHFARSVLGPNSNFGYMIRVTRLGVAIFAGGQATGGPEGTTDKYTFAGATVVSGTSLTTPAFQPAGVGTSTLGVFAGGSNGPVLATSQTYTYIGDTVASGTSLGQARANLAAAGNATLGVFGGGANISDGTTYTDKYTYSGATVAAGTVLGAKQENLAACGNATVGIFGGGYYGGELSTTWKYTYSGNVVAAGHALSAARDSLAAVSNPTTGFFGGGTTGISNSAAVDTYDFAGNTIATGTVLGTARYGLAAAGTLTVGLFGGGITSSVTAVTDTYTYSSAAVTSGTVLKQARQYLTATSSSPGGF